MELVKCPCMTADSDGWSRVKGRLIGEEQLVKAGLKKSPSSPSVRGEIRDDSRWQLVRNSTPGLDGPILVGLCNFPPPPEELDACVMKDTELEKL